MHQGGYDANVRQLAPGRRTYVDGSEVRDLPAWPPAIDGIRFGVLERRGRLLVVRLAFADQEVLLHRPVGLDPVRHLGGGRRPGPDVAPIGDRLAEYLIDDLLAANPAQKNAVALLVNRVNQVRRASREAAARSGSQGE